MEAPYFEPTEALKRAIADRHGLVGDWQTLGPRGQVHSVFRVGDAVVRIPRDDPEWISDTLTEVATLRALARSGVPTPELIAFDNQRDLLAVPYCIVAYFPGQPVSDWSCPEFLIEQLAEALVRLHSDVTEVPDPDGWLDHVEMEDPFRDLGGAYDAGTISPKESAWASEQLDVVSFYLNQDESRVFVHNDVHEHNVLVSSDKAVLIDWGDAGWGDPCYDFSTLPPPWVARVMRSYGSRRPIGVGMKARVVWNQIGVALRRLAGPEDQRARGRRRFESLREHAHEIIGC